MHYLELYLDLVRFKRGRKYGPGDEFSVAVSASKVSWGKNNVCHEEQIQELFSLLLATPLFTEKSRFLFEQEHCQKRYHYSNKPQRIYFPSSSPFQGLRYRASGK